MPQKKKVVLHHSSNSRQLYWLLGILVSLLILAKIISFFLSLGSPMGLKSNGSSFVWDQKSAVNLVFLAPQSETVTDQFLVSYNPAQTQLSILEISPLTYTDLPKGYGQWKIGSVYKLGQDQTPPQGGELLERTISQLVGLPIDGLVVLNQPTQMDDLLSKMHSNRLEAIKLLFSIKSDLTPIQALNLFWRMSGVRADKTISLNFLQSSVTDSKLLPDSSRVLGVNTVKLDLFVRDNLADQNLASESKSIAIFNATNHPGLTTAVARELTNMGGDVIFTSTSQNQIPKTQVIFSSENQSVTASRLVQIFAPSCGPKGCQSSDPEIKSSRAQINIMLGEDYYQQWFVK